MLNYEDISKDPSIVCSKHHPLKPDKSTFEWVEFLKKVKDISQSELIESYIKIISAPILTDTTNFEFIESLLKTIWIRYLYPKVYENNRCPSEELLNFPSAIGYNICPPIFHVNSL